MTVESELIETFESSVAGTAGSCVRTPAAEFPAAIDDLLDAPVVGVPLPYEGVSLEALSTDVTTMPTGETLSAAATGITPAGIGIASYGTVTVRSTASADELVGLYPRRHVVVVAASDIVPDMPAAFDRLAEEFAAGRTSQVLATGPSATADMGTLVQGVHGPEAVDIVVLEDR